MANDNSKDNSWTKRRRMACLDAVWEIDALARILPQQVPNLDEETSCARYVVRGVAGRLLRLTSVLMSGLSDEMAPVEDLEAQLLITPEKGQG